MALGRPKKSIAPKHLHIRAEKALIDRVGVAAAGRNQSVTAFVLKAVEDALKQAEREMQVTQKETSDERN